jgi:hypothetical protein
VGYAIVDRKGLPDGYRYYQMYRQEPSTLPGWKITLDTVEGLDAITLHGVIKSIIKAANADQYGFCPDILLVCHGRSDELIMPLAAGTGKHATRAALEVLENAARLLEALPEDRKGWTEATWLGFMRDVQAPSANLVHAEPTSVKAVQAALDKFCRQEFGMDGRGFFDFMADLRTARRRSPPKLEIRACNFGTSDSAWMPALVGAFFNTPVVVAPQAKTVYAPVSLAGHRAKDAAALQQLTDKAGGRFLIEDGFAIRLHKIGGMDSILFKADAGTVSDAATIRWVSRHIINNPQAVPTFSPNRFMVAGLYREGELGRVWPYVMPADPNYHQLLVAKTIPAGKLTGLAPGKVDWSRAKRVS